MLRPSRLAVVLALGLPLVARAQAPPPPDRPVFRLSIELVQIDAVVTDRRGRHVTTLGPEDFEVLQDGRPQPIAAVSYVRADEPWEDASGLAPLAPEALVPADGRRTIALVVDDLRMSFVSIARTRDALLRFTREQLLPSDRVALVTTSGAPGSSVGFGSSRVALRGAASRLRFYLSWPGPTSSILDPIRPGATDPFDVFREHTTAADALRRIQEVVGLVQAEGGRKTVVLVSEGFSAYSASWQYGGSRDGMRRLVDKANRAGVVVYALDPRGLVWTGLSAADAASGAHAASIASARAAALADTQDGLRYIAGQTGGFAVINANDIGGGLGRILADQRGYYLIGYQPQSGTFGSVTATEYRKLEVRVKRPGLLIRTRTGFYARTTE